MPFDNTGKPVITLQDVSDLLRDRPRWPSDFVWDYDDRCHCAMGLIERYWGIVVNGFVENASINLSAENSYKIFYKAHQELGISHQSEVTPEHVADLIDRLLTNT